MADMYLHCWILLMFAASNFNVDLYIYVFISALNPG